MNKSIVFLNFLNFVYVLYIIVLMSLNWMKEEEESTTILEKKLSFDFMVFSISQIFSSLSLVAFTYIKKYYITLNASLSENDIRALVRNRTCNDVNNVLLCVSHVLSFFMALLIIVMRCDVIMCINVYPLYVLLMPTYIVYLIVLCVYRLMYNGCKFCESVDVYM